MTVTKAVLSHLVVIVLLMCPGAAMAQRSGASGYIDERLNQLQQSAAELSRRIEQLQRQNDQLQQQMERMRTSYEHRLGQLEKGSTAKAPSTRKRRPKR
jgi:septal ring factor EnvC (AmiA/AmiB activator)